MQVLLLNYEFPPLGGGAGNATAYLLREFARDPEIRLDLITSSTDAAREEAFSENIRIHFLDIGKTGGLHYQSNRNLLAYSWKAFSYGRRLVRANHYDVCHAFFGIPCGFIARKLGLPYIVSLRGSDVPFYNERFRVLDRLLFKRLSVRIWQGAAWVVANSTGLRNLALESAPNQPIEVIHNGVDTEAFRPAHRRGDGVRVVCVARLIRRKGIEYLIRAISQLPDWDIRLTIAGNGNQEGALRALAHELGVAARVEFAGFVDHDAIAAVYRQHDVFVLPSLNEGMSNTVLEAMACGLPLILTDTGGTAELLEPEANGFTVAMRSAEDIAAKLRWYAENPEMIRRHGQRSREIAESRGWRSVAEAYKKLYRSIGT